ncbi:MAG: class I SAM-dependent methyltransferase [Asgard group archaeon]|nr:class I SAM-dependent methyltransferase [Asgard group archaeon]
MKKNSVLILLLLLFTFVICSNSQDRVLRFERQIVTVEDFKAEGLILAIGGGGEGTIGRLKGNQVIAIDISKRELEEAPDGSLKIIMDARELKFLDNTFNTTTSFFTLMYINGDDHEKVFKEVFRVLKPGGKFLIWGAIIPSRKDLNKDRVLVPLTIKLPEKEVRTGYGVRLPMVDHDLSYYVNLAEKVGFTILLKESENRVFQLEVQKPTS